MSLTERVVLRMVVTDVSRLVATANGPFSLASTPLSDAGRSRVPVEKQDAQPRKRRHVLEKREHLSMPSRGLDRMRTRLSHAQHDYLSLK